MTGRPLQRQGLAFSAHSNNRGAVLPLLRGKIQHTFILAFACKHKDTQTLLLLGGAVSHDTADFQCRCLSLNNLNVDIQIK